ncbi:MAG: hypothetical protein V1770_05780 [bacterium]
MLISYIKEIVDKYNKEVVFLILSARGKKLRASLLSRSEVALKSQGL